MSQDVCPNCQTENSLKDLGNGLQECEKCGCSPHSKTRRFDPQPKMFCSIDGTEFKQSVFTNKHNIDGDCTSMVCGQGHVVLVRIPISKKQSYYRYLKSLFSWRIRNRILRFMHICECTNTYHNHRAGIHGGIHLHGTCDQCDHTKHPEWDVEYEDQIRKEDEENLNCRNCGKPLPEFDGKELYNYNKPCPTCLEKLKQMWT